MTFLTENETREWLVRGEELLYPVPFIRGDIMDVEVLVRIPATQRFDYIYRDCGRDRARTGISGTGLTLIGVTDCKEDIFYALSLDYQQLGVPDEMSTIQHALQSAVMKKAAGAQGISGAAQQVLSRALFPVFVCAMTSETDAWIYRVLSSRIRFDLGALDLITWLQDRDEYVEGYVEWWTGEHVFEFSQFIAETRSVAGALRESRQNGDSPFRGAADLYQSICAAPDGPMLLSVRDRRHEYTVKTYRDDAKMMLKTDGILHLPVGEYTSDSEIWMAPVEDLPEDAFVLSAVRKLH